MSEILKSNKFFVTALVITIVLAGMTFGNMPGPTPDMGSQTIDGTTFNFADYGSVDHEMLAAFNYLNTLVDDDYQGYAEWDGFGLTKPSVPMQLRCYLKLHLAIEQNTTVTSVMT
jgi:hypothetical protein